MMNCKSEENGQAKCEGTHPGSWSKGQLLRKSGCNGPVMWREWEVNCWQRMQMSNESCTKGSKEDQDCDGRTE